MNNRSSAGWNGGGKGRISSDPCPCSPFFVAFLFIGAPGRARDRARAEKRGATARYAGKRREGRDERETAADTEAENAQYRARNFGSEAIPRVGAAQNRIRTKPARKRLPGKDLLACRATGLLRNRPAVTCVIRARARKSAGLVTEHR